MSDVLKPEQPVRVALIGAGHRSQGTYEQVFPSVTPWLQVVAVCDPVRSNCDPMADRLRVPAYYDIRRLVRERPMEAALVVTPVPSHHGISVYLSSHGVHNLTETTWASMLCQARQMRRVAHENRAIARVAENFFRFPVDRFAQTVRDSGYLGRIRRVFSYADHTGYHNNSRWIAFAQDHPDWVQCIQHAMGHPAFYSTPQRMHDREVLDARFLHFPDGFAVMDTGSGHVKGHLGRHPRPGYTEWQGERGTLVASVPGALWAGNATMELRKVSDHRLAQAQQARGELMGGGVADVNTPVDIVMTDGAWERISGQTPEGPIEYVNRFPYPLSTPNLSPWYLAPVVDELVDFALAVRGLQGSEFTDDDALMSQMMQVGAHESALQEGRRIHLPIEGDLEADAIERERQREQFGVDPLDVDAMLDMSHAKP